MTSNREQDVTSAARSKVNLDELLRGVRPIRSVDEEFLGAVRADRNADLA